MAVIFAVGTFSGGFYAYFTAGTKIVAIENTEIKGYKSDKEFKQIYLVFTDQGVYKNVDSWWYLKFNSSDVHGQILKLKGKKAKIHYYGWRIPIFSQYPNIVKVKAVE